MPTNANSALVPLLNYEPFSAKELDDLVPLPPATRHMIRGFFTLQAPFAFSHGGDRSNSVRIQGNLLHEFVNQYAKRRRGVVPVSAIRAY